MRWRVAAEQTTSHYVFAKFRDATMAGGDATVIHAVLLWPDRGRSDHNAEQFSMSWCLQDTSDRGGLTDIIALTRATSYHSDNDNRNITHMTGTCRSYTIIIYLESGLPRNLRYQLELLFFPNHITSLCRYRPTAVKPVKYEWRQGGLIVFFFFCKIKDVEIKERGHGNSKSCLWSILESS